MPDTPKPELLSDERLTEIQAADDEFLGYCLLKPHWHPSELPHVATTHRHQLLAHLAARDAEVRQVLVGLLVRERDYGRSKLAKGFAEADRAHNARIHAALVALRLPPATTDTPAAEGAGGV